MQRVGIWVTDLVANYTTFYRETLEFQTLKFRDCCQNAADIDLRTDLPIVTSLRMYATHTLLNEIVIMQLSYCVL
jgi:hypothetical protein